MRPRPDLDRPLPALPAPVDALGRAWAGASGRTRLVARTAALVVAVVVLSGRVVVGPHGPAVPVLVTTRDVPAGSPLAPPDVTITRWPRDVVPDGTLDAVARLPPDAVALGPLPTGSVVTAAHVLGGGPAGLASPGEAVVAVDAAVLPALPVGTRLDLAVTAFDGSSTIAARDATVVADDGERRWVRVARDEVAALAGAISEGRLVPAVLPPGPADAP